MNPDRIMKELDIERSQLNIILEDIRMVIKEPKKQILFIHNVLNFKNKNLALMILNDIRLIDIFSTKAKVPLYKAIKKDISSFIDLLNNRTLKEIFIKEFDCISKIIENEELYILIIIYKESKNNIPNFDEIIESDINYLFDCVNDKFFVYSFGLNQKLDTSNVNIQLYINSKEILDRDDFPIEESNKFINNNENSKFPNVIIDFNNDNGEDIGLILDRYKKIILQQSDVITMNRIYKVEVQNFPSNKIYYIQLLFNNRQNRYMIFIFEYFENYEHLTSQLESLKDLYAEYLNHMNSPIYVCIAYRDILSKDTDKYEKIFVQDTRVDFKKYIYYGTFLTTSTAYRRQNILSLLFYLYGSILRHVEQLYESNSHQMSYSELFILRLDNATSFKHTFCPYCKLGFKLAKKALPSENIALNNNINPESKQKVIQNKDLYYLNNEYTLKNINSKNRTEIFNLLYTLQHIHLHYCNPRIVQLDTYIHEKLQTDNKNTITNSILFHTNFFQMVNIDLSRNTRKHLINEKYIDEMNQYTKALKSEYILKYYKDYDNVNLVN